MCKKYPLIAMLLVGSASHSLMVSATTATMRFEGKIAPVCSAAVVGGTQKVKSVRFGTDTVSSDVHVHELELGGNASAEVKLAVAASQVALKPISGTSTTPYTPKIMSKIASGNTYGNTAEYKALTRGSKILVYLDADGSPESSFEPGEYKYEVIATISCP